MAEGSFRIKSGVLNLKALASPPSNPVLGDIYIDTSGSFRVYNGVDFSLPSIFPTTITMGSNTFTRSGAHNLTLTTTALTNATLPAGTFTSSSATELTKSAARTTVTVYGNSSNTSGTNIWEVHGDDSVTAGTFTLSNTTCYHRIQSTGEHIFGPIDFTGTHVVNGALQVTVRNASASNVAAFFTNTGILSTVSSSIKTKKNIENLSVGLDLIKELRPVKFDYKHEDNPSRHMVGLIAEELEEHCPNMVVFDENNEPSSIYYQDLPISHQSHPRTSRQA